MTKKSRSFQKRIGNGFFMNGPLTSGGLTYRESSGVTNGNELGSAYQTDTENEQEVTKGTEYW